MKGLGLTIKKRVAAFFSLAMALFFSACSDDNPSYFLVVPEKLSSMDIQSSSSVAISNTSVVSSSSAVDSSNSAADLSSTSNSSKTVSPEGVLSISTTVMEDTLDLFYYGDVNLNFKADSFLTVFERGDIVTVMFDGYDTVDVPVVTSTGNVSTGEFLLSVGDGSGYVTLEVSNGYASEAVGIERDAKFPINVVVQMKKKGGYLDYMELRNRLSMSAYLDAYPDLSIPEFANFRVVKTTGMGDGVLYRSSSPIDAGLGRNLYADSLAKVAGVATFMDLAEGEDAAITYRGWTNSYYSTQNVVFLGVPPTFVNKVFKNGLVKGFRYMIEHDGPYLVHCTYGMDRTGFTIAVLEALMGATADEIKSDYAKTFTNYYSIVDGAQVALASEQVDLIKEVIANNLRNSYHTVGVDISDFENVDLAAATEKYLLALGMESGEIEALKVRLK